MCWARTHRSTAWVLLHGWPTRVRQSGLVGGHDPQLADGGMARAGDHVGDSVGDVLGGEDLGLLEERLDQLAANLVVVVRAELGVHAARLEDSDPHMALRD